METQQWTASQQLAVEKITGTENRCWSTQAIAGILLQHEQTGVWHSLFQQILRAYPKQVEQRRTVIQHTVLSACQLVLCLQCPVTKQHLDRAVAKIDTNSAQEWKRVQDLDAELVDPWWQQPLRLYCLLQPYLIQEPEDSETELLGLPLQWDSDWTEQRQPGHWWLTVSDTASSVWWLNSVQQHRLHLAQQQYAVELENSSSPQPNWQAAHRAMTKFLQ